MLLPLITMQDIGGLAIGAFAFVALWQAAYAASLAPVMAARSSARV